MQQLALLKTRKFLPFFGTQFFGAFNDNVFKNALMIGIAYRSMTIGSLNSEQVVALSAGLFIFPFFLFSAIAGQISDKYSKTSVIRWVKSAEILIMALAALGFWLDHVGMLLTVLFLMGMQSTFFGPAKYSILPNLLDREELTGGNALVETGTFISILLGTIIGGLLIAHGGQMVSIVVFVNAIAGYLICLNIPDTKPGDNSIRIHKNPFSPMLGTFRILSEKRDLFVSALAISWFWFIGASYLTLLPTFGKSVLGANEQVVTTFLSVFCVGIAVGSLLCEKIGGQRFKLALVPLGALGISLASIDLFFASPPHPYGMAIEFWTYIEQPGSFRLMLDFFLLSVFGGFYTVPLYTIIQDRSDDQKRSRVIAANNILNALLMVISAVVLMVSPKFSLTIIDMFALVAIANIFAASCIFALMPEFMAIFLEWLTNSIKLKSRKL